MQTKDITVSMYALAHHNDDSKTESKCEYEQRIWPLRHHGVP